SSTVEVRQSVAPLNRITRHLRIEGERRRGRCRRQRERSTRRNDCDTDRGAATASRRRIDAARSVRAANRERPRRTPVSFSGIQISLRLLIVGALDGWRGTIEQALFLRLLAHIAAVDEYARQTDNSSLRSIVRQRRAAAFTHCDATTDDELTQAIAAF